MVTPTQAEFPRSKSATTSLVLSVVVVLVGSIVLIGWILKIEVLKSLYPGLTSMKANTAIAMLLCGTALALLSRPASNKWSRYMVAVMAVVIVALGAVTLCEYFIDWDPGIDQWLFNDSLVSVGTSQPGRMSPVSSLCFVLVGIALLAASQRTFNRLRQPTVAALGGAVIAAGAFALLGYLLEAGFGYHVWNYTGTALHTAAGFILLGCGLLGLVRSENGLNWSLDMVSTTAFVSAIALMIFAAGVAYNFAKQLQQTDAWVSHTHEVLTGIQGIMTEVAVLENGQRGYVITENEQFLRQVDGAKDRLTINVADVRTLTSDNRDQQQRLDKLEALISQSVESAGKTIEARKGEDFSASRQLIATGTGTVLTESINALLREMQDEENSLLKERKNEAETASVTTFLLLPLGLFLSLTTLSLGLFFLNTGVEERSRAEENRMASEHRYRTLFDYSPDGIVIADNESYYLDANATMCEMLGYTRDELIGMHASDIVDPVEIPHIGKALGIIRSDSEYQRQWRFKRKDGSRFAGEVIATKMPDGNLLGVIRDISERESSQASIRESESRLAGIIDSAMDAIITLDSGQKIVLFNAAAEMMFKCTAEEAIGEPIERFIPERFRAAHPEHVRKFGETRVTTRSMKALAGIFGLRSGGEEFPIEASISQLETSGQRFFTVILRDITERTRAEARFRLAVESAPNAMVMADNDGKIILINSQTEKLFGYHRDELIGLPVETLVPERFRGRHPGHRAGFAANPQVRTMGAGRDLFGLRKDGSEVPVEIGLNPIEMDGGTYVLSSIVDITERKLAKDALDQERNLLRLLIDNLPACIYVKNLEGQILVYNQASVRQVGLDSEADALGKTVFDFFPPEIAQLYEADDNRVYNDGQTVIDREEPTQDSKGNRLWYLTTKLPLRDANGVIGLLGISQDITVRKKTEERLRQAQERLSSTLRAGSIGTWTWDIPNDILVGDEFVARMFSIDPVSAAAGLPASEYIKAIIEEDQQSVTDQLAAAIDICGTCDIEYRVRQTDGASLWVQAKGRVEGDAEGNALNFHGAVMDITDRKRVDGRFRRLVDSNAQGVFFWNTSGEITGANDAFLDIVGYTRTDLEAGLIDWAEMTPPEYAYLDHRSLKELTESGICRPFEKEYLRKDGSRVPILLGAAIFEDNPNEGVCFLLDITEQKRIQEGLSASEKHFRFLDDLGGATRALVDPDQIMDVMARMLGEYLGVSRCAYADVESDSERFSIVHDYTDNCESTVGDYHLSLFGSKAASMLLSGQTLIVNNVDEELLPQDGADTFNSIGIKAIITCPLVKNGSLRAMMAVHQTTPRDWTPAEISIVQDVVERCWATIERRTAEEALRLLNVGLEQRVIERTADLESANKELEAFSYSVSHDLRAPLRHIDGFSQMLLEDYQDKLDATGRDYLLQTRSSINEMSRMIDDVLELARVGRAKMLRLPVDLSELAKKIVADLRSMSPERNVDVVIEEGIEAKGDSRLLHIMLLNLLGNAWKFTSKVNDASITFGTELQNNILAYFVRDNGAGFDMAYTEKLFGAFQRLHSTAEFEGTGIGLATVHRIIARHGGRVWAESEINKGATFYFQLDTAAIDQK